MACLPLRLQLQLRDAKYRDGPSNSCPSFPADYATFCIRESPIPSQLLQTSRSAAWVLRSVLRRCRPSFAGAAQKSADLHGVSGSLLQPNVQSIGSASPAAANLGSCLHSRRASAESDAATTALDRSAPAREPAAKHPATCPAGFARASSNNRRRNRKRGGNQTYLPSGRRD